MCIATLLVALPEPKATPQPCNDAHCSHGTIDPAEHLMVQKYFQRRGKHIHGEVRLRSLTRPTLRPGVTRELVPGLCSVQTRITRQDMTVEGACQLVRLCPRGCAPISRARFVNCACECEQSRSRLFIKRRTRISGR